MSAHFEESLERLADAAERIATFLENAKVSIGAAESDEAAESPPDEAADESPLPDEPEAEAEPTKAEKAAAKKAAKKADEKKAAGPSKDKVRTALQDFMAIEGKETAIELLKENTSNGAENLSQLEEDDYAAVLEAIEAAS